METASETTFREANYEWRRRKYSKIARYAVLRPQSLPLNPIPPRAHPAYRQKIPLNPLRFPLPILGRLQLHRPRLLPLPGRQPRAIMPPQGWPDGHLGRCSAALRHRLPTQPYSSMNPDCDFR